MAPDLDAVHPAKWPVRVTIQMRDGRTFTAQTDCPRGDPENPVTVSDLEKKFKGLASPVVGEQMAGCLVTAISTVDTLSRASEMISCLKTPMSVT